MASSLSCRVAPFRAFLQYRRCCTSVLRANSEEAPDHSSGKAYRKYKYEVLRQNRRNPEMEEKARLRKLHVPLSEVRRAWLTGRGRGMDQLQCIGEHSHIYQDVFGGVFRPAGELGVCYGDNDHVVWGDVMAAKLTLSPPKVTFPSHLPHQYTTLVLSNPDGHLQDHMQELLHWMVVNIPVGGAITMGTPVVPYLPPVPPKGTGFHRYVFSLYTHEQPLPTDPAHMGVASEGWLQQRLFSSSHFRCTQQVKPFTFCFFQSQWDRSVSHTYHHVLKYPEPVYGPERFLSPRKLRTKEVYAVRQSKYTQL